MAGGHEHEAGFTLIELLVAMVLSAIVLALIITSMVHIFGSSDRSTSRMKAQRAAGAAADMMTSDVRAMHAPQRDPKFTGSPDGLRALLLDGDNPSAYLVHDIVQATPTRLTFYAESVATSPREECVTWFVRADGGLQRDVFAFNSGCTGGTAARGGGAGAAPLQTALVMPAPERARASAAAAVGAPFSYQLLAQPTPADPDPAACTRPVRANLTTLLQLDQVVGINLDLRSFIAGYSGHGDQTLNTSVAVSGRQSYEYRYGLGCVA